MKNLVLAMVLVMAFAIPVLADDPHNNGTTNITNEGGAGGSATIGDISNRSTNIGINSQHQGQDQRQGQGQDQGQSQFGYVAPVQSVLFKSPTQLLDLPSQSVPELNFGNGRMMDVTDKLPRFAIFGIKPLKAEPIREVLSVNSNLKFKKLYKAVLSDATDIANGGKKTLSDVRYQIVRAEAQKTWTTGGNFGGGGSGLASSGLGGGSGAGSLIPSWGGTKSDDLFTVVFVRIFE